MLILQMRQSDITGRPLDECFENSMHTIPERYRPVLRPAVDTQLDILGLAADQKAEALPSVKSSSYSPRGRIYRAEIFTDGSNLFIVQVKLTRSGLFDIDLEQTQAGREAAEAQLWLYVLSTQVEVQSLPELEEVLNQTFGVKLQPFFFSSRNFTELVSEGRQPPPEPTPQELASARLLADKAARQLAMRIKSSGGLLVKDLGTQVAAASERDVDEIRASLQEHHLVTSEIVVTCRRTQAQVARVQSQEVLTKLDGLGLKCGCGRGIAAENANEALTITEEGRALLDGSRWFSLLLVEELLRLGIGRNDLLIDQQVGSDEVDCLAVISGELTLFELKDKDFSLGNAYSFGAKMGILRPIHAVIVTTESVGNDVKEHFQRAQAGRRESRYRYMYDDDDEGTPNPIRYIEGVENLRASLADIATEIYTRDAVRILNEVRGFASLDPRGILRAVRPAYNHDEPMHITRHTRVAMSSRGRRHDDEQIASQVNDSRAERPPIEDYS